VGIGKAPMVRRWVLPTTFMLQERVWLSDKRACCNTTPHRTLSDPATHPILHGKVW